MTHYSPAAAGGLLPLPPTSKWSDGVFDVEMFAQGTLRIVFFAHGTDYDAGYGPKTAASRMPANNLPPALPPTTSMRAEPSGNLSASWPRLGS